MATHQFLKTDTVWPIGGLVKHPTPWPMQFIGQWWSVVT